VISSRRRAYVDETLLHGKAFSGFLDALLQNELRTKSSGGSGRKPNEGE
jgi:hypothetical protein